MGSLRGQAQSTLHVDGKKLCDHGNSEIIDYVRTIRKA